MRLFGFEIERVRPVYCAVPFVFAGGPADGTAVPVERLSGNFARHVIGVLLTDLSQYRVAYRDTETGCIVTSPVSKKGV